MRTRAAQFYEGVLHDLTSTSTERSAISGNAHTLLRERYLAKGSDGEVVETAEAMFRRVAHALAEAEEPRSARHWEVAFYEVMARMEFHPGSRTLANAGTPRPQLANCFVFPLDDSQAGILQTFSESSLVKALGGGCGFNYSRIRPRGDAVREADGIAAGPVAFLKLFDEATTLFRQRGRYESGNMAILNVDHPDVLDFIGAKCADGLLSMTNISIGVWDAFMRAVDSDDTWVLFNPRTNSPERSLPAREVFLRICELACETGDPGLVFLDHINRDNPLREAMGDITATNPCGEIGLYPYEACNLGYVNLPKLLLPDARRRPPRLFDEDRLRTVVAAGVRMIDNAISVSWFPIDSIRQMVSENRRIGIGVTGWADCLAEAGIPYDSNEALACADSLASLMFEAATEASEELGRERGPFPNVVHTNWADGRQHRRNVAVLALPPSGNNAVIFDTSFSIEPFFAAVYTQRVFGGREIRAINSLLVRELTARGAYDAALIDAISENHGSVQGLPKVPDDLQDLFKTAHDIAPEWHVRMQAAFQRHVDNAVTKTVNLPSSATTAQVAELYRLAWQLGCKGITVYRDKSRARQAIEFTHTGHGCDEEGAVCTVCE